MKGEPLVSAAYEKFGLFHNATDTEVFPAGATVFVEGEDGHVMYAIKRGGVSVQVNGKEVDRLGEDEVFGEMAILDHKTRSATVVTTTETELIKIGEAEFCILVRQNPYFALQLMRLLSNRLRNSYALNLA